MARRSVDHLIRAQEYAHALALIARNTRRHLSKQDRKHIARRETLAIYTQTSPQWVNANQDGHHL